MTKLELRRICDPLYDKTLDGHLHRMKPAMVALTMTWAADGEAAVMLITGEGARDLMHAVAVFMKHSVESPRTHSHRPPSSRSRPGRK